MDLNSIKQGQKSRKSRKRVGRGPGSGDGKTSGRGHKGHGARSGWSRRLVFEGAQIPLFRKAPIKGFTNGRFRTEHLAVNVGQLDVFSDGDEVTLESLDAKGLARGPRDMRVKLLGSGEISKKLVIKVHAASKSAIEKIEKAGGKVELIKS